MVPRDQLGQPRRRVVLRSALQARIDDRPNTVDGQRCLGHIGRDHDPPLGGQSPQGRILFVGWECAVEGQHGYVGPARDLGDRASDLTDARQEDQYISGFAESLFHHGGHREFELVATLARPPTNVDRVGSTWARHDGRRVTIIADERGDGISIDRRRHHQQAKVRADRVTGIKCERKA